MTGDTRSQGTGSSEGLLDDGTVNEGDTDPSVDRDVGQWLVKGEVSWDHSGGVWVGEGPSSHPVSSSAFPGSGDPDDARVGGDVRRGVGARPSRGRVYDETVLLWSETIRPRLWKSS